MAVVDDDDSVRTAKVKREFAAKEKAKNVKMPARKPASNAAKVSAAA